MTGIKWEVYTDEANDQLAVWSTKLRNPKPAFNEMATALAGVQKEWFKTQGNGTWAPLKEPYRSWKKRNFPKRKILTGPDRPGHRGFQLRDQLTKRPFGYERITSQEMVIGSTLPYAKYHQTGTDNMVARPPIRPLNDQTMKMLTHILQVHIVGEVLGDN